ncbi:MAG TPA: cation:proton antiporter [Dehalococcoidia bacterium]|nr:cation:proton antiporter [Dehalococcoidia bacterium]
MFDVLDSPQSIAAVWMGLALLASLLSVRLGISVALMEIFAGVFGGNVLGLHTNEWINFVAGFGSVVLTFLAGAEVEPEVLRRKLPETMSIGVAAFVAPFLGAFMFAWLVADWSLKASEIAGLALSTTSVAVVYAVMVETGLNETQLGKIILAACFINDLGTVLMLGVLFANFDAWLLVFVLATIPVIAVFPRFSRWFFEEMRGRASEPEIRFLFVLLMGLGGLAVAARSEAVLPAYLLGMAAAGLMVRERVMVQRLRAITFGLLTPFFFLRAGGLIQLSAVASSAVLIGGFLAVKLVTKFASVQPLTEVFRFGRREGLYTSLLMSTGLTFGTISALFGLNHGIIDQEQYTVLVTGVVLSAVVPTLVAQRFFEPSVDSTAVAQLQEEVAGNV